MNARPVKYPRTPHLPWSSGRAEDDIALDSIEHLERLEDVVVTEKLDGENTTLYHDYLHARSIDSKSHPSRDWIKRFHAKVRYDIPEDFRICGENMYAKHSIFYDALTTYYICSEIRPPLELIPQPPSLRKRRGLRSVSVSELLLPLSSQERGPGVSFGGGGRTSEQVYYLVQVFCGIQITVFHQPTCCTHTFRSVKVNFA